MTEGRAARVATLVKAAVECGPQRWGAFFDRECGSDSALRAEVESLLQENEGASQFLEEPALHLAAESFVREGAFHPGETVGNYVIVSLIGRGGMGEVYLAEDRELHRQVALKLVRRGMASEEMIHHFKREEHLLASLNHPNIAQLYGGGLSADGLPFFAMEYVEGERLDQFCEERGLTTKGRLELFRKVCAAVTYAHQRLVIHRDLKPANIRVTPAGEPKLLDFGIAKLLDPEDGSGRGETLTLQGMMTPDYASPEQVAGGTVTTATDVYSLGVALYKLLTGRSPYRTTTKRPQEIARAITEQEPTRPSALSRGNLKSEISNLKSLRGDLDNIVLMAMRKEPSRRYSSVGQLSEDIRRHLVGLPVVARKDTVAYRTSKFVGRHRIGVAAAALVLLSLVGGMVATLLQIQVARRERGKAEVISGFLQETLNASNPDRNLGSQPTVKDLLDEASARLASEGLSDQPEVKAELQRIIGASYLSLGQYDLAEQNLRSALQTQARLFGQDGIETLKSGVSLALLRGGARGDYPAASKFYRENLPRLRAEYKRGAFSADDLGPALDGFALVRRAQGDSREAEGLLREELALPLSASREQQNGRSVAQAVLALTLADQGKFADAIQIVREKIAATRREKAEESSHLAANLTGLGSFLLENGETAESLEALREAERIYRKLYSGANLQLGDNLRLQAQAFCAEGKFAEAEARIDETLKIYRAATSPKYINYATALMVQGLICSGTDRRAEAERLLREAVRIRTDNLPATHFLRATAEGALGDFLAAQKHFPEAETFLLASHESLKNSQEENSPRRRLVLQRLINLYENWGRREAASAYRDELATTNR